MKRKFKSALRISLAYPNNLTVGELIRFIFIFKSLGCKFGMNKSVVRNDVCFFKIKKSSGLYLRIKDILYEKKI